MAEGRLTHGPRRRQGARKRLPLKTESRSPGTLRDRGFCFPLFTPHSFLIHTPPSSLHPSTSPSYHTPSTSPSLHFHHLLSTLLNLLLLFLQPQLPASTLEKSRLRGSILMAKELSSLRHTGKMPCRSPRWARQKPAETQITKTTTWMLEAAREGVKSVTDHILKHFGAGEHTRHI